jgi:hypothetical protein
VDADETGRAAAKAPGLLSWLAAGAAVLAALSVLWAFAAPKRVYDSWWESQASTPLPEDAVARARAGVYKLRNVRVTVRNDSLLVHPVFSGSMTGHYVLEMQVTVDDFTYQVGGSSDYITLPDQIGTLDQRFALSDLDSSAAHAHGTLKYYVRATLQAVALQDPGVQRMVRPEDLGPDWHSTAFVAGSFTR